MTEAAVVRRVPSLTEERLGVLSRRQPVTVAPGPLSRTPAGIQRTGTAIRSFATPTACSSGVTERDIFGRIVAGNVDPSQPVET
jgi:hypothetical protein